jgi:hypothetical protein
LIQASHAIAIEPSCGRSQASHCCSIAIATLARAAS